MGQDGTLHPLFTSTTSRVRLYNLEVSLVSAHPLGLSNFPIIYRTTEMVQCSLPSGTSIRAIVGGDHKLELIIMSEPLFGVTRCSIELS